MQLKESGTLVSCVKPLGDLLKLIKNTHKMHKNYLTQNFGKTKNCGSLQLNDKMKQEISKCEQEYDKIVTDNLKIVVDNSNVYSLKYEMNDIKQFMKNKIIKIESNQYKENKFLNTFKNGKYYHGGYSICSFDLKRTNLTDGSKIDNDNQHIKIGSKGSQCYAMIKPSDHNNDGVQGWSSGKHCWRMYYKNPQKTGGWLTFGIYQSDIVPKNVYTHGHGTSWGIAGNSCQIYSNGQCTNEKRVEHFYQYDENEMDMLVDFDNGILCYTIVDDAKQNRTYTFEKRFNTSISYGVHLNLCRVDTEVQVAKINVAMFGKNKNLVKWPIGKY